MRRVVLGELRHRRSRTLALLAGILVATTSFTVLTGASSSQRLEVRGQVTASFRTAYDVLVRPKGSRTELERRTGRVQPNFLSGMFGGISRAQYRTIRELPGIEVAAPIANLGYVMPATRIPIDLTDAARGPGDRTLVRARVRWRSDRGLTRADDHSSYVYATDRPLGKEHFETGFNEPDRKRYYRRYASLTERLPGGRTAMVCPELDAIYFQAGSPWGRLRRAQMDCWSRRGGWRGGHRTADTALGRVGRVGTSVEWAFPFLLAAIDPEQEAKLAGTDRAVTAGRYLDARTDRARQTPSEGNVTPHTIPVLAAAGTIVDQQLEVIGERLAPAAAQRVLHAPALPQALLRSLDSEPAGAVVQRVRVDAATAYERLLADLRDPEPGRNPFVSKYWTVGPTRYAARPGGALVPQAARIRDPSLWLATAIEDNHYVKPGLEARDRKFRSIAPHDAVGVPQGTGSIYHAARLKAVGVFDPALVRCFDMCSALPLETYAPAGLTGRDAGSRADLGGEPLAPNGNLGGYAAQPPLLLTTLSGIKPLLNPRFYDSPRQRAPISAIRVRVAGVKGPDDVSRERIRQAAERIAAATGLDVDVTVGASPSPQAIDLPAGRYGRPELALSEPWVKKGVAATILRAIDRKSIVLFALILVVCALFVANAASAAVRSRRTELGVLACLGWPTSRLFAVVLAELGAVGLAAGVLGGALALPIAAIAGIDASLGRAALAIPAAVLLALLAGLWPAARAAAAQPIAAVRPAVLPARRSRRIRQVAGMALTDVLRVPGRSALGALSVAIGVCALTLLLAATVAFHDTLVGTLLGDAVAVQVRATDYVAVGATVLLGAAAVADVLYIGLRERAGELATLRAVGWSEGAMIRLVGYEGLLIGAVGSLAGAALGLAGVARFTDALPADLIVTTALAAAAGTALAGLAALAPAASLRRLAPVPLLAGE
jgi:ABC-type lipoprotein release transport system permease subunit